MRETYDPAEVESVQQAHWRAKDIYRAVEHALDANGKEKPKFYVCPMLPRRVFTWITKKINLLMFAFF